MSVGFQTAPAVLASGPNRRSWDMLCIVTADILAVEVALLLACLFRIALPLIFHHYVHPIGRAQYQGLCFGILALPLAYQFVGLYPAYGMSAIKRLRNRVYTTLLVFGVLLCWNYAFENGQWSRGILAITVIFALTIPPVFETQARKLFIKAGICGDQVVVIGGGPTARAVIAKLRSEPDLGLLPIVILDDDNQKWGTKIDGIPISGPISEAASFKNNAHVALIALPDLDRQALTQLVRDLPFARVMLILDLPGIQTLWTESRDFGGLLSLELRNNLLISKNRLLKRSLDYAVALPALLLSLPLLVVCALWIYFVSPGSPLYRQEREGEDGHRFHVWKLRTMHNNAEDVLHNYLAANPAAQAAWLRHYKLKDDPRIVPIIGSFLRKFSVDEIPQLVNVLAGEMSLVGPRPLPHYHLDSFSAEFRSLRTKVAPGVTGLWQVSARSDADTIGQESLDTYYIRNWSLWLDIYILLQTVRTVLFPKGAY